MANNGTYSAAYLAEDKTALINTMYAIPIPLEIISTVLRIWVRARSQPGRYSPPYDDYLMIFATIAAVCECITGLIYGAPYGLGRHRAAVSPEDLATLLRGDYIFSHFYNIAIATTKLSVLALYYRVFATRAFRLVVIPTAIFICAWVVVMELIMGFGCHPLEAWWHAAEGRCINKVALTYFTNVTNLVADLWIFTLPIPVILKLQTSKDKRMSLIFLFSIGLGTCAISAARLSFVFGVGSSDFTWEEVGLGILSIWEPCGAILCANLPLIYRMFVSMASKVRATVKSSESRGRTTKGGASGRQKSSMRPYEDWTRLTNSGALCDENGRTVEVSAHQSPSVSTETELEVLKSGGIVVQTAFTQDSHQELVWHTASVKEEK